MKILRIVGVILVICAATYGLQKRYTTNDMASGNDPVIPLRNSLLTSLGLSASGNSDNAASTTLADEGNGITIQGTEPIKKLPLHPDFTTGYLSTDILIQAVEDSVFHGNEKASITLFHFCDYTDTGYCKEFFDEGYIFEYQDALQNNLQYTFKGIPRSTTTAGVLPHKAMRCAAQLGTPKQVLSLNNALYQQQDTLSETTILKIAGESAINGFSECLASDTTMLPLLKQMSFFKEAFSVTALPTQVFLDIKTGYRVKAPGLYTREEMTAALQEIASPR